jgi:Ca2+ insensitive EF hand
LLDARTQPYVTEMDLRHSLIPDDLIEDLLHSMPKHTGPDLEVDRQVPKYDYIGFMQRMAGADGDDDKKSEATVVRGSLRKENQKPANGGRGIVGK